MTDNGAVVVTGATSGIGQALALEFHRRGRLVYATGRDSTALASLRAAGLRTQVLDVTSHDDITALVRRLAADGVRAQILVNNAGYGLMGPLADLPVADVRRQFEVNTLAPLALIQAFLPVLTEHGDGRIVNITSVSGVLTTPFAGPYCASKSALNSLSDALRMELKPLGVRVITLQPGHIRSRFGATASAAADRDYSHSRYAAISDAIADRAAASQNHATPAEDFARHAADRILASRPRPVITLGKSGRTLVLAQRLLPGRLRDRILARRFRLDTLTGC
jgi:short-subunit dehydrogenase